MERWAVSLPARTPGDMGSQSPAIPCSTNQSRFGVLTCCNGVRPLSSGQARSPAPSRTISRILFLDSDMHAESSTTIIMLRVGLRRMRT